MTQAATSQSSPPDSTHGEARHPFAETVEAWYARHRRNLPWRDIHDPYRIWISEIILQQTRVAQGYDYYVRFIKRFPDVDTLAAASEDEVLQAWQGLGYYSRARNLHAAARSIAAAGAFPTTYEGVRALKGVGDYTAAAICSMAYGLPYAVVDGNVYRVLARYFGMATPIDTAAGKRAFGELAEALLDRSDPGTYNQAVMDFGALQCTPQSPACLLCPLSSGCAALARGAVESLPVKEKRTAVHDRFFVYLYLHTPDGHTYLRRRPADDIWQGLYEPLLLEFPAPPAESDVFRHPDTQSLPPGCTFVRIAQGWRHVLTHRRLHVDAYLVRLPRPVCLNGFSCVAESERGRYAVPRLVEQLFATVDTYI